MGSHFLKLSPGTVVGRHRVAYVLSIAGGGLTFFSGAFTLSDAFFTQVTITGAIMIFFGGLLYWRPKMAVPWSLIIIVASLSDWFSLPNQVRFGLPSKFEDFSPLLFVGPLLSLVGGMLALAEGLPLESASVAPKSTSSL